MWPSMTESVPFLCDDIKEMIQSLKGIMKYWAHLYNTDNSFIHVNPVHVSQLSNTMLP